MSKNCRINVQLHAERCFFAMVAGSNERNAFSSYLDAYCYDWSVPHRKELSFAVNQLAVAGIVGAIEASKATTSTQEQYRHAEDCAEIVAATSQFGSSLVQEILFGQLRTWDATSTGDVPHRPNLPEVPQPGRDPEGRHRPAHVCNRGGTSNGD